jgi:hypothetical protein
MAQRFIAIPRVEMAPLQDGSILWHPASGKFIMLNRSAAVIWNELSAAKCEDDLVSSLCANFPDVTAAVARRDVIEMLAQLKDLELVLPTT